MNTQTIKREDLRKLYNIACNGWKQTIEGLILWNVSNTIEVDNSIIEAAFNEANADQKKEMKKYFKIVSDELFSVTSFEELCKLRGFKVPKLADFAHCVRPEKALAVEQITIIELIYNNGWIPDFKNQNERKYYPYFINENGSWRLDVVLVYYLGFYGVVGLYKTEKIARFVGETFKDIYIKVI